MKNSKLGMKLNKSITRFASLKKKTRLQDNIKVNVKQQHFYFDNYGLCIMQTKKTSSLV